MQSFKTSGCVFVFVRVHLFVYGYGNAINGIDIENILKCLKKEQGQMEAFKRHVSLLFHSFFRNKIYNSKCWSENTFIVPSISKPIFDYRSFRLRWMDGWMYSYSTIVASMSRELSVYLFDDDDEDFPIKFPAEVKS